MLLLLMKLPVFIILCMGLSKQRIEQLECNGVYWKKLWMCKQRRDKWIRVEVTSTPKLSLCGTLKKNKTVASCVRFCIISLKKGKLCATGKAANTISGLGLFLKLLFPLSLWIFFEQQNEERKIFDSLWNPKTFRTKRLSH